MASIDELNAYKQKMAAERANVERFLAQAAQSTGNRSALMEYHRLANVRLANIKANEAHADQLIKDEQQRQKAATKTATAGPKGMTAGQQDKAARADSAMEPEAKLAENQGKQLKELDLENPGLAAAIRSGAGVANYTQDKQGNLLVPPTSTVAGQTLYSRPATVTVPIPNPKDPDALAAEKQRLLDRKALEQQVQGTFQSMTSKPVTPEMVLTKDLKFGPDGKLLPGQGVIAPGLTQEDYIDMQGRLKDTMPPAPEDRAKFKNVEIPADEYERILGRNRDIIGDENTPKSAVQKEIDARKILNEAPPDTTLAPTTGLQLPTMANVPALRPGEAVGTLRAATAGKPISELNSLSMMPPVLADQPAKDAQAAADIESQKVWDARPPQPVDLPEEARRRAQSAVIAREAGYMVRPDQAEAILAGSGNPAIASITKYMNATGQPLTLDKVRDYDYPTYDKLMTAARANTEGEDRGEFALQKGLKDLAVDAAAPGANGELLKYLAKQYAPLLDPSASGESSVLSDLPVPLQDQPMLP